MLAPTCADRGGSVGRPHTGAYLKIKLPKFASSPELAGLVRQADSLFIYTATVVKYLTQRRPITVGEQTKMLNPFQVIQTGFRERRYILDRCTIPGKLGFLTCRLRILYTFLCTAERTSTSIVGTPVATEMMMSQGLLRRIFMLCYTSKAIAFFGGKSLRCVCA